MARYVVRGVEEYALKLSRLAEKSNEISKKALYAAAAVITDRIRSNIKALPVVPDYVLGTKDKPIEGVTESGTTFRKKTPFVRPAVEDTKSAAIAALNKVIDDEYERIMED